MLQRLHSKAPHRGRLFYACLLAAGLLLWTAAACTAEPLCPAPRIDREARVRYVHDGDTLFLASGEKIRLVGIDTPELARDDKPAEPLSTEARDRLREIVAASGQRIGLRFDRERKDRYGRSLAHLYTVDGNSISAQLLKDGLASLLAVPPNLDGLDCYARTEQAARQRGHGIWQLPRYQQTDSRELPGSARGLHRVSGRITRIGEGRRNLWLNLPGRVALRIDKRDLDYFKGIPLRQLEGRRVSASGWVYAHKGELRLRVRSRYALQILD